MCAASETGSFLYSAIWSALIVFSGRSFSQSPVDRPGELVGAGGFPEPAGVAAQQFRSAAGAAIPWLTFGGGITIMRAEKPIA